MKKGTENAYPQLEAHYGREGTINYTSKRGMSIRLKIASEKMDALISACTGIESSQDWIDHVSRVALKYTNTLLKLEEETRND